ncbi:response regulator transcription factor [Colwellia sp. MEBiC06753]
MADILLVEDDERLAQLVKSFLTVNEFNVSIAGDAKSGLTQLQQHNPDLILLDINLPDEDGFTLFSKLRQQTQAPILFLTAKDSNTDHLRGLELGADDYIIKPIDPPILLARINNILKRFSQSDNATTKETLTFGQLTICKIKRQVFWRSELVNTTNHEFELLTLLADHAGEILNRDFIHQQMIGREYDGLDRTVDVRVFKLRKKFDDDVKQPSKIITVWGKGYQFCPDAWND